MLRSLNSGVSGLQAFQGQLDVIGNNIANSNTIAYKSARTEFADAFSQTLQAASPATSSSAGTAGMQIGSGVSTAAIQNNFTQGALSGTGIQTDLAIGGEGFFIVKDSQSGLDYATRAGDFQLQNGYFVTNNGLRLQGFSDSALTTRGDVQMDGSGRPATSDPTATVTAYNIDTTGRVNVRLSDGTEYVRGQVLLQTFTNPQMLLKAGDNLFTGISTAGPLGGSTAPQAEAPGTNGLGTVEAAHLELSNVDLANEFADLITTQRGFQACARIITTSDEVLQELVNLKR
ncbi:MAG: flagellar hook-basal body complex protein [Verrucomicrobiota bacterium]|nr:flagellar hook-basal body complex protein [Verrucomicrobiota bacterium]MCC6822537.1 flagellar hook-basal body complex protein [Limisphaerales bacterium]